MWEFPYSDNTGDTSYIGSFQLVEGRTAIQKKVGKGSRKLGVNDYSL